MTDQEQPIQKQAEMMEWFIWQQIEGGVVDVSRELFMGWRSGCESM